MKWINVCSAVLATLGVMGSANAGLLHLGAKCGAAKSCGCAETCQPECCKPVIVRPCGTSVHTYQRKCSTIKPPMCDTCAPSCCAPASCAPECAAPAACAPECAAPAACAPECAAPAACAPVCAAPAACAPVCAAPAACGPTCAPDCAAPADCCGETVCCDYDPCEVAELIYQSQTACYAKDRRRAIHKLGDKFDCICNPEIMTAFVYAMNDADEDVRAKAADEIGDQIREHGCCCSPCVVQALTCALADCDRDVRRQAEEALELCGYEIVDGCCEVAETCCPAEPTCASPCAPACAAPMACGPTGCAPAAAPTAVPAAPAPMPMEAAPAPAPAPPEEPKAYFPSRLQKGQAGRGKLSNLFGLLD